MWEKWDAMGEHLSREELSRLVDEPQPGDEAAGDGAREHLESCTKCTSEYETLLRMRMALSALGGMEPPAGEWERVEAALEEAAGDGGEARSLPVASRLLRRVSAAGWPAQAAAAVLVFAAGLTAGLEFAGTGSPEPAAGRRGPEAVALDDRGAPAEAGTGEVAGTREVTRPVDGAGSERAARHAGGDPAGGQPASAEGEPRATGGAASGTEGGDPAARLEALFADYAGTPEEDPVTVAEEMARLDALGQAVREALSRQPGDPTLNDLLFRIAERRQALSSRFGDAARLAALDYR